MVVDIIRSGVYRLYCLEENGALARPITRGACAPLTPVNFNLFLIEKQINHTAISRGLWGARGPHAETLYKTKSELMSSMADYGQPFTKPKIASNAIPGAWNYLKGTSSFVNRSAEFTLNHLRNKLHYKLPPNVDVTLFTAGTQIVSGINVYLEFRVNSDIPLDVQVMLHDPSFIAKTGHEPSIDKLYVSSKPVW
jgi:hypothetical protein